MSPEFTMRRSYQGLLLTLFALLLLGPFLADLEYDAEIHNALFCLVLLLGAATAARSRRFLLGAFALALVAMTARWANHTNPTLELALVSLVATFGLLGSTVWMILRHVLTTRSITSDTLYGAACVYLLLGVIWSVLFTLLELFKPGSFVLQGDLLHQPDQVMHQIFYFSFVTLTTLGYGDVTPTNEGARMLAATEAMAGQLYVALLIARLVGMHIASSRDQA